MFGAGNYSVVTAPAIVSAPSGFVANASYSGQPPNHTLMSSAGSLGVNEEVQIVFTIDVNDLSANPNGNFTNQALVTANTPSGSSLNDLSGNGLDVSVDSYDVTPISINTFIALSGFVFEDSNINISSSHDGVLDATEMGVSNRTVTIIDTGSNVVIGSVLTDAVGAWNYALDASYAGQPVRVVVTPKTDSTFISESAIYTSGVVTDATIEILPSIGGSYADINFGLIGQSTFEASQSTTTVSNQAIRFRHAYQSSTHGSLSMSLVSNTNPATPIWSERIVYDSNCNGLIDVGEGLLPAALVVVPADIICIVVDLFAPAESTSGTIYSVDILTSLDVADSTNTGHAIVQNNAVTVVVTVTSDSAGRVNLSKTVTNITQLGGPTQANTAKPGDALEYVIQYTNSGSGPITALVINDTAPAFSVMDAGSVACGSTPLTVSCVPAVAGSNVSWQLIGDILGGASGSVLYRVTVD